jgi:hypothetical protein
MNVDAADAAATTTTNASAIMTSPGSMPVAVVGLKSIGATILNIVAGNHRGSGVAPKATNINTKQGLRHVSQLNPLVAA